MKNNPQNDILNDIPEWYKEGIEKCYREGWYGLDDDCECNEPGGEEYGLNDLSMDE